MDVEKRVDTEFRYKPPHHIEAHCRVRIYSATGGYDGEDRTVVVISEAADNPGMSVTNASEDIATKIVQVFNIDPARTRWIEHYPQEAWRYHGREEIKPATYDEVFYSWRGLEAREPNWRRIPLEEIEILTGEEPD
jgi:hypothetical protein